MTHLPHSKKERPFLPRLKRGGILARLGDRVGFWGCESLISTVIA